MSRNCSKLQKSLRETSRDIYYIEHDVSKPFNNIGVKFDFIIHAGSSANSVAFKTDFNSIINSNILGMENIIDYHLNKGPCSSILFVSSYTVYGNTKSELLVEDDCSGYISWLENKSCYIYGKRVAEMISKNAAKSGEVPIKIVRPTYIFGPADSGDPRVYSQMLESTVNGNDIILRSNGLLYRPLVFVLDVVSAILAVMLNGKDGEAYNVSSEVISLKQYAEICIAQGKSKNITYADANDKMNTIETTEKDVSLKKIKEDCQWEPYYSIRDGIRISVAMMNGLN